MSKTLPTVLNLSICDLIIRDQRTNNVSLINLFQQIHASTLPAVHPKLHVYIVLSEGHGKYECELKMVRAADNHHVMSMKGQIEIKDPLKVEDIDFAIHNLQFEKAGKYFFEFWCGNSQLASRAFYIINMK